MPRSDTGMRNTHGSPDERIMVLDAWDMQAGRTVQGK